MRQKLTRTFYRREAGIVAKELIGKLLIHASPNGTTSGIIVETEAYHSQDPASHTFSGKSKRNEVMFGEAGHVYIYFIYGVHYCVNAVTGSVGVGEGVLIRALEPVEGVALMKVRRGTSTLLSLTTGPAKLVQAMGITYSMLGIDLTGTSLYITESEQNIPDSEIVTTTRIGITKGTDAQLRFYLKNNSFVSKL